MPPTLSSPTPHFALDGPEGRQAAQPLQNRKVFWFFVVQIVAGTFLQKFGHVVPISLPILMASIGALAISGVIQVNSTRLILYSIFVSTVLLSQLFSESTPSSASLSLFIFIYAPMIIEYEVGSDTFNRCMRLFVNTMLLFSAIVFLQQLIQFTVGAKYWPDLDLLPENILVHGYQYWRETAYRSGIFMPNGIFFLEPSIIGQFLVLGLVAELVYFKRLVMILALVVGAGLTMSGTAAIVFLFAAPFILLRSPPKIVALLVASGGVLIALGVSLGVAETLISRTAEFSQPGTSGYARFVFPLMKLAAHQIHPSSLYTGVGAGNATGDRGDFDLPFTKLIIEYGDLTAAAFYALLLTSLLGGGRSVRMGIALLAFHSFGGGGLIVPVYVITLIMLGTILAPPNREAVAATLSAGHPGSRARERNAKRI